MDYTNLSHTNTIIIKCVKDNPRTAPFRSTRLHMQNQKFTGKIKTTTVIGDFCGISEKKGREFGFQ